MRLYSEKRVLINRLGSDDRDEDLIYESTETAFKVGERIVSAKVQVEDAEYPFIPVSMEFTVYYAV